MQKYVNEGKPVNVLGDQEQFCISLMGVPAVKQRIRALGLKFTAAEKAAEAAAIFKVCVFAGRVHACVDGLCAYALGPRGGGDRRGACIAEKKRIKALGLKFTAAENAAEAAAIFKVSGSWRVNRSSVTVCV
jgi:hypothetical protein